MGGRDANVVDDEDEHRIHPPRSIDDYLDSAYCHGGDRVGRTYHVIFLALGLANSGDSAEISCTNYVLSSSSFRNDILFGDDRAMRGSAIAGAHFAGMFLSGLLAGPLADVRGRRSIILLGLTSNSIVGVLSSCVYTAPQLVALRFVTGLGLGMVIGGVVALAAELSPPGSRGRYMTLVSSCYTLGFLYSSFWALLIFRGEDKHDETNDGGGGMGYGNWRLFMFVNALPTMIAAILVAAYVPESPRFYLCRGRLAEAVRVANRIARAMMGGRECRESEDGKKCDLLTEGELRLYLCVSGTDGPRGGEGIDSMTYDLVDEHADSGGGGRRLRRYDQFRKEIRTSISSFGRVFANGYWRTTVPLQLCYFSLTLVTGVGTWWTKIFQSLELQADAYALSFYHTLAQIPGMMLATCLIDTVGRRRLIIVGFGGGSAALFLLSAIANAIRSSKYEDGGRDPTTGGAAGWHPSAIVFALACSYTVSLCVCWLALDCTSAESFPTRVRGTGRGVCVATGRIAGFCVQFLYGPLVNEDGLCQMMFLASAFAFGGMMLSFRTTDTTNVDLRDNWDYSVTMTTTVDDGVSLDQLDRNETDEEINSEKTDFDSPSKTDTKPIMLWHSNERDLLLSKRKFFVC